jgi:predicted metalloprotease with PDZ domain
MEASFHALALQRDKIVLYEFHGNVPACVDTLDVSLDAITALDSAGGSGPAASSNILDLNWNAVLLYPQGAKSDDVSFTPSVTLPAGWRFGTALPVARSDGDEVEFAPVSLTTLIDSPMIAGAHYRKIEQQNREYASPCDGSHPDAKPDLVMPSEDVAAYRSWSRRRELCLGAPLRQYHAC